MKVKGLLPIAILAALSLTGCELFNQTSSAQSEPSTPESSEPAPSSSEISSSESESESSESESSSEETQYGVRIANKQALLAEWYFGSSRDLDIELTPEANPQVELRNGNLVITSSNPDVVSVSGLGLSALAEGYSIVTVTYHNASDEVYLTIVDGSSAVIRYGADHSGKLEDPLTNEDALLVAKHANYEGEAYYVKGTVKTFYHSPGERTDGAVSWFLEPAQEGGEKFEIYKCYNEDGSFLTDDDVWKGGEAVAYGKFTSYQGQYETTSAVFVSCEGNKPEPRGTVESTVANALQVAKALEDGDSTWDYYEITGYVVKMSGNNFFLADRSDASTADNKALFEIYTAAQEAPAYVSKLKYHAKVKVKAVLKNYHNQIENLLPLTEDDITVLEEGLDWVEHPEPEVTVRTLAEFIAGENVKTVAYSVTAQIKAFKNGETKDKYGNMTITDGVNDLIIYGATMTASALAWDKYGSTYIFTNPQDFISNEESNAIEVGATITMKLIRADYTKNDVTTIQGTGVITNIGGGEDPLPEPVDLISLTDASLLGYSGTQIGYGDGSKKVEGVNFEYVEIGAYGSGLQMRTKNGKTSTIYNTVAFASELKSIELTIFAGKEPQSAQEGTFTIKLGSTDKVEDEEIVIDMVQGQGTYTATVEEAGMTFFHFEKTNSQYTNYVASINLNFVAEEPPAPVELPKPVGNFTGYAVNALDQSNVFVTVALGEEAAYVEVGDLGKFTTTYTYNNETGLVTIVDATFGTITATFDVDNNQLINGTLEGTFASFIANNGEMTFTASEHFWNCDGTTEELQALFKRRYMSGSWQVDTGNADRFVSVENAIAGTAVQRRGFSGGAVSMVFNNDFEEAITVSNIGFWVYNPSANDVTFRMWGYQDKNLGNNFETGTVTAVAGQWTYIRMGFGSKTIYNFQIADFTNSGVAFIFDNIALF